MEDRGLIITFGSKEVSQQMLPPTPAPCAYLCGLDKVYPRVDVDVLVHPDLQALIALGVLGADQICDIAGRR